MTLRRITTVLAAICATLLFATSIATAETKKFGLGREATENEIKAWDIDVRPDGQGLPVGQGTAAQGEEIFAEQCAACHGDFAEGVDRWPVLAGGQGTLTSDNPVKTIGSYWPYLSTVYDYIYRAMPFGNAQSLTPDQMYAITAYLLQMNNLIDDPDFVLSNETFKTIKLPNEANFTDDPRPNSKNIKNGEPCMSDCKPEVKITMRARILDVTPKEGEEQPSGKIE